MTKILTAILAVVAVVALGVASIGGLLVGGVVGFGGGNNQTVTVTVPGVSVPGATTVAIPASITSTPGAPMGGTIYNRMIDFTAGITVDGATTTLATTTVTHFQASGAVVLDSDLTVAGTFNPAYISTTTTSTLATTTITRADIVHLYVTGDTTLVDATSTNHTVATALQSIGTLIVEGLSTLSTVIMTSATTTNATTTGHQYVEGGLDVAGETHLARTITGGSVADLGVAASSTITAAHICDNSILTVTPTTSADRVGGMYIIATSSLINAGCMGTDGDKIEVLFRNATSSFGASTTIAVFNGSGIHLLEPSGGDVIILPQESARIIITRQSSTTSTAEVTSLQDAD